MTDHVFSSDILPDLEQDMSFLIRGLECLYRQRRYPVERAQYLLMLQLLDGACPSGELASRLKLDHSTVTRQIAALEANGHIIRRPHPDDGRSMLIELSPTGRRKCLQMRQVRMQGLHSIISRWSDEEIALFSELVARFNDGVRSASQRTFEEEIAFLEGRGPDTGPR